MGSSSSKSVESEAAVSSVGRRSFSRNVFQTSCIRPSSGSSDCSDIDSDDDNDDDEQVSDHPPKENATTSNHSNMISSNLNGKLGRNKNAKTKRADRQARLPSEPHLGEWGESSLTGSVSRNGSGSSRNPSTRFLSRFRFFPGNLSSRSSRAYPESSTSSMISNDDRVLSTRFNTKTKTRQGCELFPSCFLPTSAGPQHDDSDPDSDDSDASSIQELGPNDNHNINGMESDHNLFNRRLETREPVEQNVRFSRTLSVGRLRDRVLHRPPFPDSSSFPSSENAMIPATSSNSSYVSRDPESENTGAPETSYPSLLEHRANFLERRRRIRSQVHALQRMGSRFDNLSGHERSCILSGQHRTGHCTCRLNTQDTNNARGSISRIFLLAEALIEVLDEIHQQSVISSSQTAPSSFGSIPAPTEAVEALPVNRYRKLSKQLNEEDAQCYICLVEYEDGDEVRVLPCHHEFHRLCVDKWLKEIHRICPLCRGDVCVTNALPA